MKKKTTHKKNIKAPKKATVTKSPKKKEVKKDKYFSVFNQASDAIMITDFNGNFKDVNPGLCKMFGYTHGELLKMNINALIDPDELKVRPMVFDRLAKGEHIFSERTMMHRDGTRIQVEANVKKIDDKLVLAIARDVTDKKRNELLIQKSEAHLRSIFDITDTGYLLMDSKLKLLTLNAIAAERSLALFGVPMNAGDNFLDFLPPHRKEISRRHLLEVLKGNIVEYDVSYVLQDKSTRWFHIKSYPIRGNNKEILGACMSTTDITENRNAGLALREAYDRLTGHMNNTPLAVIEWDADIRVTQWSRQAEKIFGWTAEEAIGQKMNEKILYEDDTERVHKYIDDLKKGILANNPNENRNRTRDGRVIYCEWYNSLLRDKDGNISTILSLVNDITEKKVFETELREAEIKFRSLVEKSLVGVYIMQNSKFAYVNSVFAGIFGHKADELIGMPSVETVVHPEDRAAVVERVRMRMEGEIDSIHYETRGLKKNGDVIWIEIFGSRTLFNGQTAIIGTLIDITDRKRAEDELHNKNEELRLLSAHLQKIREEERKNIAREIHDELGQLLTGIKMDASWLIKKFDSSQDDLSKRVDEMLQLTDRTIQSVRRIATQLRPGILDDLGLEEAIHWQANEMQNKTGISFTIKGKLTDRKYSPELSITAFRILQESLTNVIRHAGAKHVTISLEDKDAQLHIEIRDDGKGIEKDKQEIRSLGIMGMKERASMMGGSLAINSVPLKGTTVRLSLPL